MVLKDQLIYFPPCLWCNEIFPTVQEKAEEGIYFWALFWGLVVQASATFVPHQAHAPILGFASPFGVWGEAPDLSAEGGLVHFLRSCAVASWTDVSCLGKV